MDKRLGESVNKGQRMRKPSLCALYRIDDQINLQPLWNKR